MARRSCYTAYNKDLNTIVISKDSITTKFPNS